MGVVLAGVIVGVVGWVVLSSGDKGDRAAQSPSPASEAPAVTSPEPIPTPEPDPIDPVETPAAVEDTFDFTELEFGEDLPVTNEDGTANTLVTVSKPTLANCQYDFIGCDKPETGDRVIQVEVTIENVGSTSSSWGTDFFILEFADGTQMSTGDGVAFDYTPDNAMDYDIKVRPGSTYRSVLVFEAPKGGFSILILSSPYDGEPFASWS